MTPTNPTEDDLRAAIKNKLSLAYYNGLDRKGWSQYEEDAAIESILALFTTQQDKLLEAWENKLLDKSVALKNEDTVVPWDDIVALLTEWRTKRDE